MAMTCITWLGVLVALHDLYYQLLMVSQDTSLTKLQFSSELFSETVSFMSWSCEQVLELIIACVSSEAHASTRLLPRGSAPQALGAVG